MAIDLNVLATSLQNTSRLARVVVTGTSGSAPRGVGTSMLVGDDGQSGTIGGGALEYEVVGQAKALLTQSAPWRRRHQTFPLGPGLGQCCGGSVSVLIEAYTNSEWAEALDNTRRHGLFARPTNSGADLGNPPMSVARLRSAHRRSGALPAAGIRDGWWVEPQATARTSLWIYGAGHVGRALVETLHGLAFDITWVDTDESRFPTTIDPTISKLTAVDIARLVEFSPPNAHHLIVTYSHAIDLEICHALLCQTFEFAGLIGSKSKWARFRSRLAKLGHDMSSIDRITCPIGMPELGKSPQAIAIGVAARLLGNTRAKEAEKDVAL